MNAAELYGLPPAESDAKARKCIEECCAQVVVGGLYWHEMEATAPINLDAVTDALLWLEERGGRTEGFIVVRSPTYPSLIRFEGA